MELMASPKNLQKSVKSPLPHQKEALQALYQAAQKHDRYTCVMACGTGKTLVSIWHTEQIQAKTILILVPSLGLLHQTVVEWRKNFKNNFDFICVCSNLSFEHFYDEITQFDDKELDFQITTQLDDLKNFINCSSLTTKIIFSTYHSANIVSLATQKNFKFDIIVFDEAHKTAGYEGKYFGLALYNNKINANKRFFLTATPRIHFDKSHNSDDTKQISMNNESLYGPIVYNLNFSKAVSLDIIVDYKIIISVITSNMVNKFLETSKLKFKNKNIGALYIAHMLAIEKAIKQVNVNKIITFHSKVDNAKLFCNLINSNNFNILKGQSAYHINGAMNSQKRTLNLKYFENSNNAILTNARCLTEGIDIPSIDMIAFFSNKRSRIDIVQASGRVMRKAPGKKCGYILLPLYVNNNYNQDSLQEALNKSNYSDIWYILNMLSDHDDTLNDAIRQQTNLNNPWDFIGEINSSSKVQITYSHELDLDTLKKSITTKTINRTLDSWEKNYINLQNFYQTYQHCHIPKKAEYNELYRWTNAQRTLRNRNLLNNERIILLNKLNFIWDYKAFLWESKYNLLEKFYKTHGHCDIPRNHEENISLGNWVASQRGNKRAGILSEERIKKLDNLNFTWKIREEWWDKQYNLLKRFFETYGHCNIPRNYNKDPSLGYWVSAQRKNRKESKISRQRIEKLNQLNFIWNLKKDIWQANYQKLVTFHKKYGHANPNKRIKQYKSLGNWASDQRKLHAQGQLSKEKIEKLNALQFTWDCIEALWNESYEQLCNFYKKYNHSSPNKRIKKYKSLGNWASDQRKNYKLGKLSKEKINKLNLLNFCWDPINEHWENYFKLLKQFYDTFNHCNLNNTNCDNHTLVRWVQTQRLHARTGKLNADRTKKLNTLNFTWNPRVEILNKKST